MKKLLFLALLYSCATHTGTITIDKYTDFVDPLIGSGGHGHVFVGANVPHGMVQLGPTQMSQGWDWSSGYHSSDSTISGFCMTHLSGTGIGDKGDIHFMPTTGGVALRHESFFSSFSHSQEQAEAGFYSVMLLKYGIQVQLTASERTGFQRYIFPFGKPVELIIDLKQGIGWDWPTGCELRQVSPTKIEGLRLSTGWAKDDRIYFTASFSHPITAIEVASDTSYNPHNKQIVVVDSCYYRLVFAPIDTLECQVAISGVDIQGARANFESEARGRSFEQIRSQAQQSWNSALGVVQAEGADSSRLRTFYTALYHTMFFPSIFSDVDGRYRGADGNTHKSSNFKSYTIFSLWDTYRAAHPLFTLTEPDRVSDMVNSMLAIYDEQGKLPVWHLWGNETDCMVGFGSVQVIADAMLKGVKGFDYQRAYEALKAYAKLDERGLKFVRERGYIPADSMGESVAMALEYCISDASIASVAKMLGQQADYDYFLARSLSYKKYFDPSDCFVKGLMADGIRRTPFSAEHSTHRGDDFCEGNAWQYSWMVPHDPQGLYSLYSSLEAAELRLDSLFSTAFVPSSDSSPDISGMIGQYAHGNEPSHSTIFHYAWMGKPEKTAAKARFIMDSLYFDAVDGLSGNEDCGQMSAWYVLNAMGLYQPNPAGGEFFITSPIFDKVTLALPNDKSFTLLARGASTTKPYHHSAILNGKPYTRSTIDYKDIMAGGELILNY